MVKNSTILYVANNEDGRDALPQCYVLQDLSIRKNHLIFNELERYCKEPSEELTNVIKTFARTL